MNLESPLYLLIPIISLLAAFFIKKIKIIENDFTKIADSHLLKHIVNIPKRQNMRKYLTMFGIICLLSLALANPRWGEREYKLYTGNAASVIVLDVSSHMGCQDVRPTRSIRARQIASEIVNNYNQVNFGLLAFAKNTHLIAPITQDQSTLNNYLPAIDYRLVYQQGQDLDSSLDLATEMLDNESTQKKSIIVLSSGNFTTNFKSKYPVYVIGIGTEQGAPMHDRDDQHVYVNGQLQITKLNLANLKKLAESTNGKYFSYLDIQRNVKILSRYLVSESLQYGVDNTVKTWNDGYPYILILVAALIALSLRQGLIVLSLAAITFLPINQSHAVDFDKLFKNNDQIANQAIQSLDFATAGELFSDPYNKGVSFYKNKQYDRALQAFKNNKRPEVNIDALYNTGNSYYMLEHYKEAVESYEEVLKLDPNHEDAKFNLELARKKLKEEDSKDKKNCGCKDKNKDNKGDSKRDNQQQNQDQQNQDQQSSDDNSSDDKNDQDKKEQPKPEGDGDKNEDQNDAGKDEQESQPSSDESDSEDGNQQEQQSDLQESAMSEQSSEQQKNMSAEQLASDEQQQKWLQRINSDISNFLKTRMYIDDLKSNK